MDHRFERLRREATSMLSALDVVLTYLYMLDVFKPTYWSLVHRVMLDRTFNLGILNQGIYGILPIFTVAAALNILPYLIKDTEDRRDDGLAIAHTLLLMTIPLYLIRLEELAWLLPALSGLIMVSKNMNRESIPGFARDLFLILTVVEGLTLIYWVIYLWNPRASMEVFRWILKVEAGFFQIHTYMYPILLLATLYSWVLLPSGIFSILKFRLQNKFECRKAELSKGHPLLREVWTGLGLVFTLMLTILLPLIPFCPSLNPHFKPASTDIFYYKMFLENMLNLDYGDAVKYAFYGQSGNRPLYLLLLYGLTCLGVPKNILLNFEALLIAPIFTLSVYFSAKRFFRKHLCALLASLVGVLGFNMTVGVAAGFFAAWIAMALFYVCIALAVGLDRKRPATLATLITMSIIILFIHPWTWSLLMVTLTLHLIISCLRNVLNRKFSVNMRLLTVLTVNVIADILKTVATPRYGGVETVVDILETGRLIAFKHFLNQSLNLRRLSTSYMGGAFYNPLHMILSLIGTISLLKRGEKSTEFIFVWIVPISLVFPFSTLGLQAHLLFAAPFPLLIAEGLWRCSRLFEKFDTKLPILFQLLFLSSSLSYTLRILCNLV
ncbi:hypothetical protein J7L70_07040 [Candidatus Bathyarchaeota archaeon]|nr:hypothetical protein [Candidatus Bathyarchaeota archaeon]